jgi:hypothetical protein
VLTDIGTSITYYGLASGALLSTLSAGTSWSRLYDIFRAQNVFVRFFFSAISTNETLACMFSDWHLWGVCAFIPRGAGYDYDIMTDHLMTRYIRMRHIALHSIACVYNMGFTEYQGLGRTSVNTFMTDTRHQCPTKLKRWMGSIFCSCFYFSSGGFPMTGIHRCYRGPQALLGRSRCFRPELKALPPVGDSGIRDSGKQTWSGGTVARE